MVKSKHKISLDGGDYYDITEEEYNSVKYLVENRKNLKKLARTIQRKCSFNYDTCYEISKLAFSSSTAKAIEEYISNRQLTLDDIISIGNVYSVLPSVDLTFLQKLYNVTYKNKVLIGNGEVLLTLLVKNSKVSKDSGDMQVRKKRYEIKADGGRLKGHKGYNSGDTATKIWSTVLKELCNTFNVNCVIPTDGSLDYNFVSSKEALRNYGYGLFRVGHKLIIETQGKFTKHDLINLCINGLKSVYTEIDSNQFNWLHYIVNDQGVIEDYVLFRTLFAVTLIQYYYDIEKIENIIAIENTGVVNVLNRNNISEYYKYIKIKNWPSFARNAGSSGQVPAIIPLRPGTTVYKL